MGYHDDLFVPKYVVTDGGDLGPLVLPAGQDRNTLVRTVYLVRAEPGAAAALVRDHARDEDRLPAQDTEPYWSTSGVQVIATSAQVEQTC